MGSIGIDRRTGHRITDERQLAQSIEDRLATRIGTRFFRRWLGCRVPSRIDAPMNDLNRLGLYHDIAEAIADEPRFRISQVVTVDASLQGRIQLALVGEYRPNGLKGDPTPAQGAGGIVTLIVNLTQAPPS